MSSYIDLPVIPNLDTSDSHDQEHSEAIRVIRKELDGYAWVTGNGLGDETATGSMADGYVCFGTGPTSIAGDNDLYWDRAKNQLKLNAGTRLSAPVDGRLLLTDSTEGDLLGIGHDGTDGYIYSGNGDLHLASQGGDVLLTNSAGDDFGLLQLGGTSASYPALKRSATVLHVRLADDTDYADLIAENITSAGLMASSSGVRAAASSAFYWNGRSSVYSDVDGSIRLSNSSASDFDLLQLGGTSADFPAIGRIEDRVAIRTADDAYGHLQTGSFTGNYSEVVTNTYTVLRTDHVIGVRTDLSGACAVTINSDNNHPGRIVWIKDAGGVASGANITISTEGSEQIDGAATKVISGNYNAVTLCSTGSDWIII